MKQRIKLIAVVCAILTLGVAAVLVTTNQPTTDTHIEKPVKFILSSWTYPDEYDQGIDGLRFYANVSGGWVSAPYYTHYYPDYHEELGVFYYLDNDQDYTLNWSAGVRMKIRIYTVLNATLTGASDLADGKNYFRHSISVAGTNGTVIFSQQNFTYYDSNDLASPLYWYEYEVILDFVPIAGEIYTATISYEVYGVW